MIDYLLGQAPLGHGQGGAVAGPDRHIGPPYYLINDTFTTDLAAGSVNGTDAEPGPGRRKVIDTESKMAISGGAAAVSGGKASPVTGDPGHWYEISASRQAGRLMIAPFIWTSGIFQIGWSNLTISDTGRSAFQFNGANAQARASGVNVAIGTITSATQYRASIVLRESGAFYFLKTTTGNWLLLWIANSPTDSTPLYPAITNFSGAYSYQDVIVPADRWLPAPLASDGFSAWGSTDGLGHAEGVTGGIGSGGNGEAWTANAGTWGASGGVAQASALASGQAIATVDTGAADVIATVKLTRSGGTASVIVRYTDTDNYVRAVHTGTNAQLIKRVGGSETTLINTAATYVAGARLRVTCEGQKFRLFYNDALIGTEQTIADAGLASGTRQGLRTSDTGNTFDDFVVYARGSGGEYATLDDF